MHGMDVSHALHCARQGSKERGYKDELDAAPALKQQQPSKTKRDVHVFHYTCCNFPKFIQQPTCPTGGRDNLQKSATVQGFSTYMRWRTSSLISNPSQMNTFIKYKIKEGVEKWSDKDIHTKYKPSSKDSTAYLVKSAWKHLRAYSQFLYRSTVCRPAPFFTPRLRNTTTGNVCTSYDFPKTAGWALGWERVARNKMMSNSPSRLQFRLLRESLSKKQELWHRCWESAALGCLFRGGGTNSLGSWEPSQKLCLEPCPALPWTAKRNYGNPSQKRPPRVEEQSVIY